MYHKNKNTPPSRFFKNIFSLSPLFTDILTFKGLVEAKETPLYLDDNEGFLMNLAMGILLTQHGGGGGTCRTLITIHLAELTCWCLLRNTYCGLQFKKAKNAKDAKTLSSLDLVLNVDRTAERWKVHPRCDTIPSMQDASLNWFKIFDGEDNTIGMTLQQSQDATVTWQQSMKLACSETPSFKISKWTLALARTRMYTTEEDMDMATMLSNLSDNFNNPPLDPLPVMQPVMQPPMVQPQHNNNNNNKRKTFDQRDQGVVMQRSSLPAPMVNTPPPPPPSMPPVGGGQETSLRCNRGHTMSPSKMYELLKTPTIPEEMIHNRQSGYIVLNVNAENPSHYEVFFCLNTAITCPEQKCGGTVILPKTFPTRPAGKKGSLFWAEDSVLAHWSSTENNNVKMQLFRKSFPKGKNTPSRPKKRLSQVCIAVASGLFATCPKGDKCVVKHEGKQAERSFEHFVECLQEFNLCGSSNTLTPAALHEPYVVGEFQPCPVAMTWTEKDHLVSSLQPTQDVKSLQAKRTFDVIDFNYGPWTALFVVSGTTDRTLWEKTNVMNTPAVTFATLPCMDLRVMGFSVVPYIHTVRCLKPGMGPALKALYKPHDVSQRFAMITPSLPYVKEQFSRLPGVSDILSGGGDVVTMISKMIRMMQSGAPYYVGYTAVLRWLFFLAHQGSEKRPAFRSSFTTEIARHHKFLTDVSVVYPSAA